MRVSSGPHLITCWSFIKIRTIGQTDFTVCVYCEGVESDTTCSPMPVSDVTWQMTTLAADKIYQHSHASWPWPRRLEWRLHLICCIKTSLSWRDQPTATVMIAVSWHLASPANSVQSPRPATLPRWYTYAGGCQSWGVGTQSVGDRCDVLSVVTQPLLLLSRHWITDDREMKSEKVDSVYHPGFTYDWLQVGLWSTDFSVMDKVSQYQLFSISLLPWVLLGESKYWQSGMSLTGRVHSQ